MQELNIEWRHYGKEGTTCLRCSATGTTLLKVVEQLRRDLAPQGIGICFYETVLSEERMPESNLILINGIPVEEILNGAKASVNSCASCGCLTGKVECCRTIEYGGKTHEEIPEELIRMAIAETLRGMNS